MNNETGGLVEALLGLPIFEVEWVLLLLLFLSVVSVAIVVERAYFFIKHSVDVEKLRATLEKYWDGNDFEGAAKFLAGYDTIETNVVLFGLRHYSKGPDSVEDLLSGAEAREKQRYKTRLSFLATMGSNAPFIGLFGTVLGIIKAFGKLGRDLSDVGADLMGDISEALVATGVGLFVAIPAVIAFNIFIGKVEARSANTELLARSLLAELKAETLGGGKS